MQEMHHHHHHHQQQQQQQQEQSWWPLSSFWRRRPPHTHDNSTTTTTTGSSGDDDGSGGLNAELDALETLLEETLEGKNEQVSEEESVRRLVKLVVRCCAARARCRGIADNDGSGSGRRRGGGGERTSVVSSTVGWWRASSLVMTLLKLLPESGRDKKSTRRGWWQRWLQWLLTGASDYKDSSGSDSSGDESCCVCSDVGSMELDALCALAELRLSSSLPQLLVTVERMLLLAEELATSGHPPQSTEIVERAASVSREYVGVAEGCAPLMGTRLMRAHLHRLCSMAADALESAEADLLQMADEIIAGCMNGEAMAPLQGILQAQEHYIANVERWLRQQMYLSRRGRQKIRSGRQAHSANNGKNKLHVLRRKCIALRSMLRELYVGAATSANTLSAQHEAQLLGNALKYTEALWCEEEQQWDMEDNSHGSGGDGLFLPHRQHLDHVSLARFAERHSTCFVVLEPMVKCYEENSLVPRIDCWVVRPRSNVGEMTQGQIVYCPIPLAWTYDTKSMYSHITGMSNIQFQQHVMSVITPHLPLEQRLQSDSGDTSSGCSRLVFACGNSYALRDRLSHYFTERVDLTEGKLVPVVVDRVQTFMLNK